MKRLQFCQGLLTTLLCAVSTGLARSQTAHRVAQGSERVLVVTEDLLAQLVAQAR